MELRFDESSRTNLTGLSLSALLRHAILIFTPMNAKGHSAQSDLFWRIHQNAALCYLLLFLLV